MVWYLQLVEAPTISLSRFLTAKKEKQQSEDACERDRPLVQRARPRSNTDWHACVFTAGAFRVTNKLRTVTPKWPRLSDNVLERERCLGSGY